ncbi:MAG TPA: hypothetical protein VIM73_01230 [Polyangiaceae bacterium]
MNERVKFVAAMLAAEETFGEISERSEVVQLPVAARKKHPRWGPRKLLVVVQRQHPRVELPAASRWARF